MGFRFRKSKSIGPFRLNISKSGIGYSIGSKGFRYSKKAGGGERSTVSIPGTGISYAKDHSERSDKHAGGSTMKTRDSSANQNNSDQQVTLTEVILVWVLGYFGAHKFYRKRFGIGIIYLLTFGILGIGWIGDGISLTSQFLGQRNGKTLQKSHKVVSYIAAAIFVFLLGSCGTGNDTTPVETTTPEPSETVSAIGTTATEAESTASTELTDVPATIDHEADPDNQTNPTTTPTTENVTEATKESAPDSPTEESIQQKPTEGQAALIRGWDPSTTVYVSNSGKIHRVHNCSGMKNYSEMSLGEADSRGYEYCQKCW